MLFHPSQPRNAAMTQYLSSTNLPNQQPPFQVDLNLSMKVQPLNEKFNVEPLEISLGGQNVYSKKETSTSTTHRASDAQQTRRFESSRTFPNHHCSVHGHSENKPDVSRPQKSSLSQSFVSEGQRCEQIYQKMKPLCNNFSALHLSQVGEVDYTTHDGLIATDRRVSAPTDITPSSGTSNHPKGSTKRDEAAFCHPRKVRFNEYVRQIEAPSINEAESLTNSDNIFSIRHSSPRTPQSDTKEVISDKAAHSYHSVDRMASAASSSSRPLPNLNLTPLMFYKKINMRIRYIANSIVNHVDVILDFKANAKSLFIEPVELICDNDHVWCQTSRAIAKEIQNQSAKLESKGYINDNPVVTCKTASRLPSDVPIDLSRDAFSTYKKRLRIGFIANCVKTYVDIKLKFLVEESLFYFEPVQLYFSNELIWEATERACKKEIILQRYKLSC